MPEDKEPLEHPEEPATRHEAEIFWFEKSEEAKGRGEYSLADYYYRKYLEAKNKREG